MNRLCTATRGIGSWRERLAHPDRQWKRGCSAFETAVSWELASKVRARSGLPEQIEKLLCQAFAEPILRFAIAEHKVPLPGGSADSQNDVWALVDSAAGGISLSVEAKAEESFGDESLAEWLTARESKRSLRNRRERWDYIRQHLPTGSENAYSTVAYQLLHRCACAVIEAKRFGLTNAVFMVQHFEPKTCHFAEYESFCAVLGINATRGSLQMTSVGQIKLGIGWADCPPATDRDVARTA